MQPESLSHQIALDPDDPQPAEARTREKWIHVWAIIGFLQGNNWDLGKAAAGYQIPRDAVQAAVEYYRAHQAEIDARLEANRQPV
jgi:uncharacterized protein (DUF433 family)